MAAITQVCSTCGKEFEPQFRYQMEERVEHDADGRPRAHFAFYCSQACLDASHAHGDSGQVTCDACATSFRVELASQVVFVEGRRHYACSPDCRAQVLAEARGARLGEGLIWGAAPSPAPAPREVSSSPLHCSPAPSGAQKAPGVALPTVPQVPAAIRRPPAPRATPGTPAGIPLASARTAPPAATVHAEPHAGLGGGRPRVVAVFNHKGGTGKTTTAVTLAAGLAERGQRVLLVDTDGQGNVAVSLGTGAERSLYHVLVMGLPLKDAVVRARDGLDVLISNETLAAAELYLAGRKNRDRVLATRLAVARESYDYVIVDCSPSLSLMNQNALVFADAVLCPVACDYLSLVGVRQVLRTIKQVNKILGHPVQLWGVLPTMFDARARICHEALDTLREHFKERCLEPIRAAIRVKEAPSQGKTVLEHAPGTSAADDYVKVVDRLLAERLADCAAPSSPAESDESDVPALRAG